MIYLYILRSLKDNGYYIGITSNIGERIKKHNRGETRSTKRRKPFILVYKEAHKSYKEARIREKLLKSYKGGNSLHKIINSWGIV